MLDGDDDVDGVDTCNDDVDEDEDADADADDGVLCVDAYACSRALRWGAIRRASGTKLAPRITESGSDGAADDGDDDNGDDNDDDRDDFGFLLIVLCVTTW